MVLNFSEYESGKLVFKSVEEKESADKSAKFKKLNVELDVGGNKQKPVFELCPVRIPNGIKMEQEPGRLAKLQAFVKFPMNKEEIEADFREQGYDDASERATTVYDTVKKCVGIKELDEIKGWVAKKDLELTVDVGLCTGKVTKKSIKVFESSSSKTPMSVLTKGMEVEVIGKSEDGNMLNIKTGGEDGFFATIKKDIAKMVFDNKVRCGFGSKSYEDILAIVRDPVYYGRDKQGKLVHGKDPSSYMKVTYFPDNPSKGMSEKVADFTVPAAENSCNLDLQTMQNKSINCIPCLQLLYVYIGSGKVLPQFYITSAIVTSVDDFKSSRKVVQQSTMSSLMTDAAMMEKLKEQVNRLKLSPVKDDSDNQESSASEGGSKKSETIESFLESGPTLHDADLDNDIDGLSDDEN